MGKQRNDKQQSPTVEHKELYSIFSDKPHEKEFKIHMYIFMCITESHCCAAELNATLKANGIPLQYSCLENPMEGGAW